MGLIEVTGRVETELVGWGFYVLYDFEVGPVDN